MTGPLADSRFPGDDPLAEILRDDALVDTLSLGLRPTPAQPIIQLLSDWRAELESATPQPSPSDRIPAVAPFDSHRGRRTAWVRPHGVAAAFAAATIVAASGVAAATDADVGPFTGLHNVLFGVSRQHSSSRGIIGQQVTRLLNRADATIRSAQHSDGIASAARREVASELAEAGRLIARTSDPPALVARLRRLRAELAAMPGLAGVGRQPSAQPDDRGHGSGGTSGSGDDGNNGGFASGSDDGRLTGTSEPGRGGGDDTGHSGSSENGRHGNDSHDAEVSAPGSDLGSSGSSGSSPGSDSSGSSGPGGGSAVSSGHRPAAPAAHAFINLTAWTSST